MSIFFKLEPKVAVVYPDEPTVGQMELALSAFSDGKTVEEAAAAGDIQPSLAADLLNQCRYAEGMLIEKVASDDTAVEADALQLVQDSTKEFFPAQKFLEIMEANAGGDFAQLVLACKAEVTGEVTP